MKKIPKYLDDVTDYMAEMEEKHMGTPKSKAKQKIINEAIDESMTAKNPRAKGNPTVRVASDLDVFVEELSKSPSGGSNTEKIFRRIEVLSEHLAEIFLEYNMGIKKGSLAFGTAKPTFTQLLTKDNAKNWSWSKQTNANKDEVAISRYYKLCFQSIVFSMIIKCMYYSGSDIKKLVELLEGKKDLRLLTNIGNRKAHAKIMNKVMEEVLRGTTPLGIYNFLNDKKSKVDIKGITAEELNKAKEHYKKIGEAGMLKSQVAKKT